MTELVWSLAGATTIGLPLYAFRVRGRVYAVVAVVILAIALPGALATHVRLRAQLPPSAALALDALFAYGMAAAGTHLASLVTARLRSPAFRLLVSIPGMVFVAAGTLAGVWLLALAPVRAILAGLGQGEVLAALRWADALPLIVAAGSVVTSVRPREEVVRIVLPGEGARGGRALTRVPVARHRRTPPPLPTRALRIVQIADPHVGPWQPIEQLRRRVERLVSRDPDLVLLTGDFLTMEGAGTRGALAAALAPLQRLGGRCFAVLGNHDYDSDAALAEVRDGLERNDVCLLVDDEAVVATAAGPTQIVGADYVGRGRRAHVRSLLREFPRRAGHARILLLHDPSAFHHVPPGDVDLTLSGHTHGGQVGLVSLGLPWTVLSRSRWPDHGLFAKGSSLLYVHRGTGFYGFPLRVGVPGEASLLEVVL